MRGALHPGNEEHTVSTDFGHSLSVNFLKKSLGFTLQSFVFTNSEAIFDAVTFSKRHRKLRLMNYASDVRNAYQRE